MNARSTIRLISRQTMPWLSMLVLLLQPVGFSSGNCKCCATAQAAVAGAGRCCGETATGACCAERSTGCCDSSVLSCCADQPLSLETLSGSPCSCGDDCRCGAAEDPQLPSPVTPSHDSTSEHVQGLILALAFGQDLDVVGENPTCWKPDPPIPSMTARQRCALLSRFTC